MYVICPMAHLIAITFDRLSWKDILTSPVVWKKWTMTVDSKSESNDKESLHRIFFWTDVKEIFYYLIFFSVEECFLNLSADIVEWQNTKIAICIDALAKNCHRYGYKPCIHRIDHPAGFKLQTWTAVALRSLWATSMPVWPISCRFIRTI